MKKLAVFILIAILASCTIKIYYQLPEPTYQPYYQWHNPEDWIRDTIPWPPGNGIFEDTAAFKLWGKFQADTIRLPSKDSIKLWKKTGNY